MIARDVDTILAFSESCLQQKMLLHWTRVSGLQQQLDAREL